MDEFYGLEKHRRFILWELRGKDKVPIGRSGKPCDAHNTMNQMWLKEAVTLAEILDCNVGFVICGDDDLFFIDIDGEDHSVAERFPGALVCPSQSGRGVHVIGTCIKSLLPVPRRSKSKPGDDSFDMLATGRRFVALTLKRESGRADADCTEELIKFINERLLRDRDVLSDIDWTDERLDGQPGLVDTEVITRACGAVSTPGAMGISATFEDIWTANTERLAQYYKPRRDDEPYDRSAVDAALAQHLAFWCGGNCEQIMRVMLMNGLLVRDKWTDREDTYLRVTVLNAVKRQSNHYKYRMNSDGKTHTSVPAPPVKATDVPEDMKALDIVDILEGEVWERPYLQVVSDDDCMDGYADDCMAVDTEEHDESDLMPMRRVTPDDSCMDGNTDVRMTVHATQQETDKYAETRLMPDMGNNAGIPVNGKFVKMELCGETKFMSPPEQIEYFDGCVYVIEANAVLTPHGDLLKADAFKAAYGGYKFDIDGVGGSTKNAFDAFTQSLITNAPKVRKMCFNPSWPQGLVVDDAINTYVPLDLPCIKGDVSLFLRHLEKLLPVTSDREILLDYMAACIQRPGDKFQWCPMIQGCEGNGKTLLATVLRNAIGRPYYHQQDPDDVKNTFNAWIERSIIVCIEEIFVNDKHEMTNRMKAMITNDYSPVHGKSKDQRSASNCAKFILMSNHKDGVNKHTDDRRYAIFFTAQQSRQDKCDAGMDASYFNELYSWVNSENGIAALNYYLHNREVKTNMYGDAPMTSSYEEAIYESLGAQERIILEAIDNYEIGLREGILASNYVDNVLREGGYFKKNPKLRQKILKNIGYISHSKIQIGGKRLRIYVKEQSPLVALKSTELGALYRKYNHNEKSVQ